MRRTIRQFLLIAHATALEGVQQPITLLLTLACVLLTGLVPLTHLHVFGEEGRLARDSGLGFLLVFGLWVTGFTAGFTVSDELRRGTAAALLAKPVGRSVFLLGKWAGGVAVLALFAGVALPATLLAERTAEAFIETPAFHGAVIDRFSGIGALAAIAGALLLAGVLHFFRRVRFGLAALALLFELQLLVLFVCAFVNRAGEWRTVPDLQVNPRVLPAALLVFLLLAVHAALATALSTRFGRVVVLAVSAALLFLGFLADPLLGSAEAWLPRMLYPLIPDVQHFWMADALGQGGRIPPGYLLDAGVYAAVYTAAVLALGVAAFRRRDIP